MINSIILKKIEQIKQKLKILEQKVSTNLHTESDFTTLSKYKRLKKISGLADEYFNKNTKLEEMYLLLKEPQDSFFLDLIREEIQKEKKEFLNLENRLISFLSEKETFFSVFIEIRSCAGGKEASLFVADLFNMYQKFAQKNRWNFKTIDLKGSTDTGVKEVITKVSGHKAYSMLKMESGVHRIQRIPVTESSDRIHTSTASVAVIPQYEDKQHSINPKDLKIDTFRSSGAGGQHVNVTDSAVRITHIPTGITAESQGDRSQQKNRKTALSVLEAKVNNYYDSQKKEKLNQERQNMIGTGERGEKIRTYNVPQNRVTDHRFNLTVYNLEKIFEGNLDILIDDYNKQT